MKRPFMGAGITLAVGVAAGWFGILWWFVLLLAAAAGGISITGYCKKYWTDRTCKYVIGLSVLFVVGFCRGFVCFEENETFLNENFAFENKEIQVLGTVKRIQKKNKVDYLFIEDETGACILAAVKKEMFEENTCYKGQIYSVRGEAEPFEHASNPGQFDEANYYCSLGVNYRVWVEELNLISEGNLLHQNLRWFEDLKMSMIKFYSAHMDEAGNGIVQAAVLGERSALDTELKRYYQENGWMHLITTSGLHLSFIAMNSYRRLRKMTIPMVMSTIFAWVLMLGYGYMTDYGDSMLRAMGMMVLALTAKLVGRRTDGWTSLVTLASMMLILRPSRLFSAGFWLTYAAVGGMEFGKWLMKSVNETNGDRRGLFRYLTMKNKQGKSIERNLRENVCIQTGIFVCTLPILLRTMYEIPVFGFFYNFFMIPLISMIVPIAFASGLSGVLGLPLLKDVASMLLKCIDKILNLVHLLPSKVWVCGMPNGWQMIVYGLAILCGGLMMNRWRTKNSRKVCGWMLIGVSCMFLMFVRVRLDQMIFVDVGQGDGICILTKEGQTFLVDGGSSDISNVYTYRLEPLLKYYGIDHIDGWFLSHSDQDHISGIAEALEQDVSIQNIFLPDCEVDDKLQEVCIKAAKQGIDVRIFRPGDVVKTARSYNGKDKNKLIIQCLYPTAFECTGDKNNDSMVLSVRMCQGNKTCRVLLTGDLEMEGEDILINAKREAMTAINEQNIDILKVAHHGSSGSTSEAFLSFIQPEWAIISCGKGNRYGHPHKETLERLSNAGCQWVSTASKGAVFVRMTSQGYRLYSYQNQD